MQSHSEAVNAGLMPGWCPASECFYLVLPDGTVLTFPRNRGLYRHRVGSGHDREFAESAEFEETHGLTATACLIAAEHDVGHAFAGIPVMSKEGLTPRQAKGGELARTLQMRMGFQSDRDMSTMVRTNPINNLPITSADIAAASRMYGRDAHYIRGNTTWKSPRSTMTDYLPAPRRI